MGNICATTTLPNGINISAAPSAKVVDLDGRLQEFRRPVTAAEVLSLHRNCYLCCSDAMFINSSAPQLEGDHVLQIGQIYFLMPLSKLLTPLSLQDLCALAIVASKALSNINSAPFVYEYRRLGSTGWNCIYYWLILFVMFYRGVKLTSTKGKVTNSTITFLQVHIVCYFFMKDESKYINYM